MMQAYHDLLAKVLAEGVRQPNRTGTDTLTIPGASLAFDLRDGYPAVTTKKLFFNAMKGELLGFFRGYDNAADFRALNCKIWDKNANETASWVNNPARKGEDDLGDIYGVQWTRWADWREVPLAALDSWVAKGYREVASDPVKGVAVVKGELNQLEKILHTLLTNPYDRRMVVSGWRPDMFDRMALPPCHVLYQALPSVSEGVLNMTMYQRSCDLALGIPFNCCSAALMLSILARLTGYTPGKLTMFLADVHVYVDHIEGVQEQLTREHYPAPQLWLSDNIKPISVDEVPGALTRIQPDDIKMLNYQSHPAIDFTMAA